MNAIPGPDAYGQASFAIVERNRNPFGDPVMAYAESFLYYVNSVRLFELVEALNCGESRPFSRVADELHVYRRVSPSVAACIASKRQPTRCRRTRVIVRILKVLRVARRTAFGRAALTFVVIDIATRFTPMDLACRLIPAAARGVFGSPRLIT